MKVCLVLPPSDDVLYTKIFGMTLPPTGLAYLAGYLTGAGHKVSIIDMPAQQIGYSQLNTKLSVDNPDVVGIYCAETRVKQALSVAQIAKENNAISVLGGPEASLNAQTLLSSPYIDVVVRGEGELTFLDLLFKITSGSDLKTVRGISFKNSNQICTTHPRSLIHNLDSLPFPPWNLFPIHRYALFKHLSLLSIASSRGCSFHCDFCAVPQMYQNTWRGRTPSNVVDELEYLSTKYKPATIFFSDDSFMADLNRVEKICKEIQERKLDLFWFCLARTDISANLMYQMKQAGCAALLFNIESHMMDHATIVMNALKNAKNARIVSVINFVFGFPGETYASCLKKIDFISTLPANHAMFFRNTSNSDLDPSFLSRIEKQAYRNFYLRKKYLLNHLNETIVKFKFDVGNHQLALIYPLWFVETIRFIHHLS